MIENNLQKVKQRIHEACQQFSRTDQVTLVAVSKKQSIESIWCALHAGQLQFGENYLQEALEKIETLKPTPIIWHFIGPIQSNKTRKIAENFSWVHTVDKEQIALRLNEQRPAHLKPLNVCVQVNISDEETKSGLSVEALDSFLSIFHKLDRLKLRGLMVIPQYTQDKALQEKIYQQVQTLYNQLRDKGWEFDTLSMGMSHDLESAIKYGATMVRVGQAIFGPRE